MQESRTAAIHTFLAHGGSICPYARSSTRRERVVIAAMEPPERLAAPRRAIAAMRLPEMDAAIVVADRDPPNHAESRELATVLFGLIAHAALGAAVGDDARSVERSLQQCVEALNDPYRHPAIPLGSIHLIPFTMCPAYPDSHPRFAPHLCVVLTRIEDVGLAQVKQPEVVGTIRSAMAARAGALYDADNFYLPMP